jgi:2-methylisocitrate lyase-like PEP mutase family enzyme
MFAGRSVDSRFTSSLVVSAFVPKPVNSLLIGPKMRLAELADAGVKRVSLGRF